MSKCTSDYMYYMYDDSCTSENKEVQYMCQRVSQFTWTYMSAGSSDKKLPLNVATDRDIEE